MKQMEAWKQTEDFSRHKLVAFKAMHPSSTRANIPYKLDHPSQESMYEDYQ